MQVPKALAKAALAGSGPLTLTRVEFAVGTVPMRTRIVSVLDAEVMLVPPADEELAAEDLVPVVSEVIQMANAVEARAVEVAVRDDIFI